MLKNNILKIINTTFVNDLSLHKSFIKDLQKNKKANKEIFSQNIDIEELYEILIKMDFEIFKAKIEHYAQLSLKKIVLEINYKKEYLRVDVFKKLNSENGVLSSPLVIEVKNKNNLGSRFLSNDNKIELENYFSEKYILNNNFIKKNYSKYNNQNLSPFDLLIEKEVYNFLGIKTKEDVVLESIHLNENILSLFVKNKELEKTFKLTINDDDKISEIKLLSVNNNELNKKILLNIFNDPDNLDNIFKLLKINEFV